MTTADPPTLRLEKLLNALSDEEIDNLCFHHFPDVYGQFSRGLSKGEKILRLIEYCRNRNLLPQLEDLATRAAAPTCPAAAAALLAQMPTDALPPHAPLPPHSRITYACNPHFVGREPDLLHLAATLKGDTEAAFIGRVAAATGLGGIGKTQMAVEFAHRFGQFFGGGVFWLSLADAAAVPAEVVEVGHCLNLPGFDGLSFEAQVQRVRQTWQEPIPRLLIFDNCEEETLLDEWKPKTGGCRVLVTSRRAEWKPTLKVRVLPLGVLPRRESLTLLVSNLEDQGDTSIEIGEEETGWFHPHFGALNAIAAELGDLPLALHLAGSYLGQYPDEAHYYLRLLQDEDILTHPALQGGHHPHSPTDHDGSVERTFALSIAELDIEHDGIDDLAYRLLQRMASFAHGETVSKAMLMRTIPGFTANIPLPWLDLWLDHPGDAPEWIRERMYQQDIAFHDAMNRLVGDLGLLTREQGPVYRLHRLLAAYVGGLPRRDEDPHPRYDSVQALLREVTGLLEHGDPRPLRDLEKHLRKAVDAAFHHEDELAGSLCNAMGYYLDMIGDYQGAHPYLERALAIREQVLGPVHPHTATSLFNLGKLLQEMGKGDEARPLFERELVICVQRQGWGHSDTLYRLRNLLLLYLEMGDEEQARSLVDQAMEDEQAAAFLRQLFASAEDEGDTSEGG